MKLTEKDKKLLYLLCILVIMAAFGFFLIKPQFEKREKLNDRLEEARSREGEMKLLIATTPASEAVIKNSTEEYEKVVADFYPLMNSNQIEQNITKMVLEHQLTSVSLNVSSQPEPAEFAPYFASVKAMESAVAEKPEEGEGAASEEGEEAKITSGMIYASQISVVVSGSEEQMKALVDTICLEQPAIRITGYQMNEKSGMDANNELKNVSTMTLTMELYMCEK